MKNRWFSRGKVSKKEYERSGGSTVRTDGQSTRKAGQGVKDDTVPQGVWYEVIYAGRHRQI